MMAVVNSQDRKEQRVRNAMRMILLQKKDAYKWMEEAQEWAEKGLRWKDKELLKIAVEGVLYYLKRWNGDVAGRPKKVLKDYLKWDNGLCRHLHRQSWEGCRVWRLT